MAIKNWDTRKFKQRILDQVERNAEATGVFVRQDARLRLARIENPKWGRKYRRGALVPILDYVVERKANEIVVSVGMGKVATSDFMQGKSSTHFGFYIEMGSRKFGAQPYLRPAVFQNAEEITRLLTAGIGE